MADPADITADESMKARSKSVSLPPALWDEIEAHAAKHYGGNRSAYIRTLFERDRDGQSQRASALSKTVLEDLARIYIPTRADQLIDELVRPAKADPSAAINQPVVIENLLTALLRALREPGFESEAPFELADKARVQKWEKDSNARLSELAGMLAQKLGKQTNALAFAAEPQADYGTRPQGAPLKRPPPPAAGKTG